MTADRATPRKRRGDGIDTCKFCGSESLFSGHFDADGYSQLSDGTMGGPVAPFDTVCQDCGKFQDRRNTKRNAGGRMLVQHNDGPGGGS